MIDKVVLGCRIAGCGGGGGGRGVRLVGHMRFWL